MQRKRAAQVGNIAGKQASRYEDFSHQRTEFESFGTAGAYALRTENYAQLVEKIHAHCEKKQIEVTCYQSNHEGALVDRIQEAYFEGMDGIVINPGAYTHTSIAILDAVKAVQIPTAEVHISNVKEREDFRQVSYIRQACCFTVMGHGTDGYLEAIDYLAQNGGKA